MKEGLELGDRSWINAEILFEGFANTPITDEYMGIISSGSPSAKGAGLFALRASDSHPAAQYSGVDFIVNQDFPAEKGWNSVYAKYCFIVKQAWTHAKSIAQGLEFAIVNRHPTPVRVTPFNSNEDGITEIMRFMAENLGKPKAYNPSVALTFGGNEVKFWTGINVSATAIDPDGEFLALPEGCALAWYAPDGTRTRITVINGQFAQLKEKT